MTRRCALLAVALLVSLPLTAQPRYDGVLHDQGRTMDDRSPRADAELDRMRSILGQWDVAVTTHPTDSTTHRATGQAEIAYMNRGYAYQERRRVPAYDAAGRDLAAMSFLVYTPGAAQWGLGEGSTYTEHIEVYSGTPSGDGLALSTSVRRGGSTRLTHERVVYTLHPPDAFSVEVERAVDDGPWMPTETRRYTRRAPSPDFMAVRDDAGAAAADRPEEAGQFDFLLGVWEASHRMQLPTGPVSYTTTATASHVLGGRAILEHSWFDTDPSLPDAATSILRLYNRAARRWESLYLTNRANSLLDFGGVKEGDRIVLHPFDTDLRTPIAHYVFHDIEADRYAWYGETSSDRGATFNTFWTITFTRR